MNDSVEIKNIEKKRERINLDNIIEFFIHKHSKKSYKTYQKNKKNIYKKKKVRTNHDGVLEFSVHLKKQILMLKGTTWEVPIIYQKYKINKIIRQSWRVYFINTTSSRKLLSWRMEFYWDHSNRWSQIPYIYFAK